MNVTELGIVIEARFSHEWNERFSIRVNSVFVGNVTEVSNVQPWNVLAPILMTEFGIVMEVSFSQPLNAD